VRVLVTGSSQVNILGALNVYDAAAARDIPVVQIGTGHKGQPNPYAITKACAEDLGLARAGVGGERIVVVRAFHAYGPGQKACAPHGRGTVRKIVPSMVCRALTGMPVQVNGSGDQAIDLVYVDDVAAALADALHAPVFRSTCRCAAASRPTPPSSPRSRCARTRGPTSSTRRSATTGTCCGEGCRRLVYLWRLR
jgi:nucleoside-diphosphate-sugar epimerase